MYTVYEEAGKLVAAEIEIVFRQEALPKIMEILSDREQ